MSHICKFRGAKRLGINTGVVELPVDLARFNLTECCPLLHVVEYHQKVFAFLRVSEVIVGHGDDRTVIFHDDGREFKRCL